MHRSLSSISIVVALALFLSGCTAASGDGPPSPSGQHSPKTKTMQAFHSEAELTVYLRQLAQKQARRSLFSSMTSLNSAVPEAAPAPLAKAAKDGSNESITNTQHAGVDEGSIVKLHGQHLVILRRGRLFTVALNDRELRPISAVDAFGPDSDPGGTWYDEMLVSEDTVAVIGYSYQRGGTEVGLFNIDSAGTLSYRSTYQLRSNDYFSSRNYASRLIGDKLIFYAPLYLYTGGGDPFQGFPAVRRWHKGATSGDFKRILPATQVYRPAGAPDSDYESTLHTVMVCDLAGGGFDCKATSVIGPAGRVFYVSPDAVYVWVSEYSRNAKGQSAGSMLYRMPLDGSGPSALKVSGSPVDQFSFLESADQHLNVLVRSDGYGDAMWSAEKTAGSIALMRVPVDSFSDGSEAVPTDRYLRLPRVEGYAFQNRFVGDYLLYGAGSGWGYPQKTQLAMLYAVRWDSGDLYALPLAHGVDRIEQMGSDAVVIGSDGSDLHFTPVRLAQSPEVHDDYVRKNASQGELRSHGFFYKPETADSGMLGLPVALPARAGYRHLFETSAAILFLRNNSLQFEEAGELAADVTGAKDDGCRASCVDWYGNAQPIFVHGRVLALLGYELVEGAFDGTQLREVQRVNFAEQITAASRR